MKKGLLNYQLSLSEIAINNANEHSEVSTSTSGLNNTHQKYVAAYHQSTSLYLLEFAADNKVNLFVYDTESEREGEAIKLKTQESIYHLWCAVHLPNAELFCLSNNPIYGATLIIDSDYRVCKLASGAPCVYSSAIYFNRNVYCFGGRNNHRFLNLSRRFDLNINRWIELTSMPKCDWYCYSIAFNSNILISGQLSNILLYSVEIDSFSEIPYKFAGLKGKILINAKERLYLIESDNGAIYESRVGDEYAWEIIGSSTISIFPSYVYWTHNKGGIYIGCIEYKNRKSARYYYKFNLDQKKLIKLQENKRACNIF